MGPDPDPVSGVARDGCQSCLLHLSLGNTRSCGLYLFQSGAHTSRSLQRPNLRSGCPMLEFMVGGSSTDLEMTVLPGTPCACELHVGVTCP